MRIAVHPGLNRAGYGSAVLTLGSAHGLCRVCSGIMQGLLRDYAGFAQGLCRVCSGIMQGLLRDYAGFAQGMCTGFVGFQRVFASGSILCSAIGPEIVLKRGT